MDLRYSVRRFVFAAARVQIDLVMGVRGRLRAETNFQTHHVIGVLGRIMAETDEGARKLAKRDPTVYAVAHLPAVVLSGHLHTRALGPEVRRI